MDDCTIMATCGRLYPPRSAADTLEPYTVLAGKLEALYLLYLLGAKLRIWSLNSKASSPKPLQESTPPPGRGARQPRPSGAPNRMWQFLNIDTPEMHEMTPTMLLQPTFFFPGCLRIQLFSELPTTYTVIAFELLPGHGLAVFEVASSGALDF